MSNLRELNAWVIEALRAHGVEPGIICFPGRTLPQRRNGVGGFVWDFTRDGKGYSRGTSHGRLCNGDVAAMLFKAGVRVDLPPEDHYGERHPMLMRGPATATPQLDDAGVRDALIDDTESLLSPHRDQRESA
jgi:hypothetical protein